MKKLIILLTIALSTMNLMAQKLDKAKDYLTKGKLAEAKTEIDNFLNVEKNKTSSEAWFQKAKIYIAVSRDAAMKTSVADAKSTAFDAIKEYYKLEGAVKDSTKRYISMMMDGNTPLVDLYRDYSAEGATFYNANNFGDALGCFQKSLDVFDYLYEKKIINQSFDTTTVLYTGICAEKANKPDVAAVYYGKIAERRIQSEGFIEIYKWLADYHAKKGDVATASKFVDLGRKTYPGDQFWDAFDLDMVREKGTKDELWKKYEEVIANNPENHLFRFNYGVELYQAGYDPDATKRPSNSVELVDRAATQLKKCIEMKPDYASAYMVMGQLLYNQGVDVNNAVKAIKLPQGEKLKPEEIKKREELKKKKEELRKEVAKKFDEALPYFEKVDQILGGQGKLKMEDKQSLKDAYDLLIMIYENKDNKEKAAEYTEKFNTVDKKHS